MNPFPSSAPLCACGTLAVWFPTNATTAVANQRQRGATAAATSSTASSLLGPAFAALKSSAGGSSVAGQWLVGKKPATLTMSSSGRGGVLVQARMKGKKRREKEKNSCLSPSSLSLSLPPRFFFHSFSIQSGPRRREEARGRLRSLPRGLQDGPPLGDDGRGGGRRRRGRKRTRRLGPRRRRQGGPRAFFSFFFSSFWRKCVSLCAGRRHVGFAGRGAGAGPFEYKGAKLLSFSFFSLSFLFFFLY